MHLFLRAFLVWFALLGEHPSEVRPFLFLSRFPTHWDKTDSARHTACLLPSRLINSTDKTFLRQQLNSAGDYARLVDCVALNQSDNSQRISKAGVRSIAFSPSSPSSKMLGGGISMTFFKTKGQDFCGSAGVASPLGWSATVTAALPGIVRCQAPSRWRDVPGGNDTEELPPPPVKDGNNKRKAARGLFHHYSCCFSSKSTRLVAAKPLHSPLVLKPTEHTT